MNIQPPRPRAGGLRLIRVTVACLAVGVVLNSLGWGFAVKQNADRVDEIDRLVTRIEVEGRERRDQACVLNERDHLADVQNLKRAYDRLPEAFAFYMSIAPADMKPLLRSMIAQDLKRLEQEARVDQAPEYCDEPGVGLVEPDPVIPERRSFKHLLNP
jgi:hypothetical protein